MLKNKMFYSVSTLVLVALILGGIYFYKTTAALVVWSRITHADVLLRNQVMRIYNPTENRDLGLHQLIQAATRYEILKKHGVKIQKPDLIQEGARIDRETLDPVKINKIKEIFKNDLESYYRIFVLPVLVDQKIYSIVTYGNKELHQDSYSATQKFLKVALEKSSEDFLSLVSAHNGQPRILTISTKKGMSWQDPTSMKSSLGKPISVGNLPKAMRIVKEWFSNMKTGDILPEPLDFEDVWWAVKLRDKKVILKDEIVYVFDVGVFVKIDPSTWLAKETQKISVYDFSFSE